MANSRTIKSGDIANLIVNDSILRKYPIIIDQNNHVWLDAGNNEEIELVRNSEGEYIIPTYDIPHYITFSVGERDIRPIEWAEIIVQNVQKMGILGLKTFNISREKYEVITNSREYQETEFDVIERSYDSCWHGLNYFRMWLSDENLSFGPSGSNDFMFDITNIDQLNEFFLKDGVYYLEFEGWESHYFLWIINQNFLTYGGTYGGACGITVQKFDKSDYFNNFLKAMKGSLKKYEYVFQIEAEVNQVGFKNLWIKRSPRFEHLK